MMFSVLNYSVTVRECFSSLSHSLSFPLRLWKRRRSNVNFDFGVLIIYYRLETCIVLASVLRHSCSHCWFLWYIHLYLSKLRTYLFRMKASSFGANDLGFLKSNLMPDIRQKLIEKLEFMYIYFKIVCIDDLFNV